MYIITFINIPTAVTAIHVYAFARCRVLQVIDVPHRAVVDPNAFKLCRLLQGTLTENGADCIKGRFDELPIHQLCYKFNNSTVPAMLMISSIYSTLYKMMIHSCGYHRYDTTPYLVCQPSYYQHYRQAAL